MDWKDLFTNFDGRIGRQSWWIGTLVLILASLVLYFILATILGAGMMADMSRMNDPGFFSGLMRRAAIQQLIMLVIIGYPVTALMSKRLNDRDRPGWLKWVFWAPSVLSIILALLGLAYSVTDVGGVTMPAPTALMSIVSFLSLAVGIWALVDLGILKGTQGPNQHGPDPLG